MKQLFAVMALAAIAASASAQTATIDIQRNEYGSGTPGMRGIENADVVENNIYHAPQYLPFHPTAGTIWPRVVEVPCVRVGTSVVSTVNRRGDVVARTTEPKLKCDGYNWTPKMGRGEYLFFKPVIAEPPAVSVEVRERVIIKEVPRKKIHE